MKIPTSSDMDMHLMKTLRPFLAALCCVLCFSASAMAISLDAAKAQGLVGEKSDGYIAAVTPNPSGDVISLIQSVNKERRETYASIASRHAQPLAAVEKRAAEKLKERTLPGQFYQTPSGSWAKK